MREKATNNKSRMLKLEGLMKVINHMAASAQGLCINDIMELNRISRRTAERMLVIIKSVYPEQLEEYQEAGNKPKYFKLKTLYRQGPISFSKEEHSYLYLASLLARHNQMNALAQGIDAVELKLRGFSKSYIKHDVEDFMDIKWHTMRPGYMNKFDLSLISIIRNAILSCNKLHIKYDSPNGSSDHYLISPYGILYGQRVYVIAYCEEHTCIKGFILSDIMELEVTDGLYERDTSFSLQDYAKSSFDPCDNSVYDVVWRASPKIAKQVMSYSFHPDQILDQQNDGSLLVKFKAGGLEQMCHLLFMWHGEINIEAPDDLKFALYNLSSQVVTSCKL